MELAICQTCGTQFADAAPPPSCPICTDERQYVGQGGQTWTTLGTLARTHWLAFRSYEPDLVGIGMVPGFAIGQRALLVRTAHGNVLWDCLALVDDASVRLIGDLGGLAGIAISHPHYYTSMVEWSRAFGGIPIHLHGADRAWVMRPDPAIAFWEGEALELSPGLTLHRLGGHFAGATVLHWPAGAQGRGVLLTGDVITVVADRARVSFMRSYPNLIPLPASTVRGIAERVAPLGFDRIYGAFWDTIVTHAAAQAVATSAERYVQWTSGQPAP